MNGATARKVSGEDERILGLDLEMQTHRCLFVQQRDKYKRVLPSVLLGRWEVSGVPRRVGQAAPGITAPGPLPGPRPHLGYLSGASAELGSVPGAGPGSSDSGPHASEADASLCTLRSSVPASKQETGPRGGGGRGEPKQGQSAGVGAGLREGLAQPRGLRLGRK